jgi:hypothetical protein
VQTGNPAGMELVRNDPITSLFIGGSPVSVFVWEWTRRLAGSFVPARASRNHISRAAGDPQRGQVCHKGSGSHPLDSDVIGDPVAGRRGRAD